MVSVKNVTGLLTMSNLAQLLSVTVVSNGDPLSAPSTVVYQNQVYVLGDELAKDHHTFCHDSGAKVRVTEYSSHLKSFDLKTYTWTHLKSLPSEGRCGHSAVIWNDAMYVYGGFNGLTYFDDMYRYEFATNSWSKICALGSPSSAGKRNGHTAVVHDNSMYVIGGNPERRSEVYIFDFLKHTWSKIVDPAVVPYKQGTGTAYHTSVLYKDHIYTVGGFYSNGNAPLNIKLWKFDPATHHWEGVTTINPPKERGGHGATLIGSELYIFGGCESTCYNIFNDMWKVNLETGLWTMVMPDKNTLGPSPLNSCYLGLCSYENHIYSIAGGKDAHCYSTQVRRWTFAGLFSLKKLCLDIITSHRQDYESRFAMLPADLKELL
jgi:Kelch motif protein